MEKEVSLFQVRVPSSAARAWSDSHVICICRPIFFSTSTPGEIPTKVANFQSHTHCFTAYVPQTRDPLHPRLRLDTMSDPRASGLLVHVLAAILPAGVPG